MNLPQVNALTMDQFVARFSGVFEHSPWVAERAWSRRPFDSINRLHEAMMQVAREAGSAEQLALMRAHPELAGREAVKGSLTADSSTEQGRLGFMNLDRGHFEQIAELNRTYRQRFGIPCIVALKLHASRASVMAAMQRRLGNTLQAELAAALEQIGHITRGRLDKIVEEK
ncbi:MAG: 2-oxo-4-hydroxy-4-carboxy-5-ureidoimidazoline decarboxylase [Betaproteobacteria bacterium]|nr:2-oxo-4-hydroxy-4-carboxy-5-ureidoimidazoline decarboxylase [Betaproteobacteria bacterium]